ncbi:MAG: hypothetical protein ACI87C_001558 [Paraperlucidibaca sp.]|jgi:hypothetical protein
MQDVSCLMERYNWVRPHQFNAGLAPAVAEENLKLCPRLVDHYRSILGPAPVKAETFP